MSSISHWPPDAADVLVNALIKGRHFYSADLLPPGVSLISLSTNDNGRYRLHIRIDDTVVELGTFDTTAQVKRILARSTLQAIADIVRADQAGDEAAVEAAHEALSMTLSRPIFIGVVAYSLSSSAQPPHIPRAGEEAGDG